MLIHWVSRRTPGGVGPMIILCTDPGELSSRPAPQRQEAIWVTNGPKWDEWQRLSEHSRVTQERPGVLFAHTAAHSLTEPDRRFNWSPLSCCLSLSLWMLLAPLSLAGPVHKLNSNTTGTNADNRAPNCPKASATARKTAWKQLEGVKTALLWPVLFRWCLLSNVVSYSADPHHPFLTAGQ